MRDGKWCEECFTDKLAVVKHRCMPGSIPGAIVGYLEAKKWNKEVLQKYVDWFLPPSKFMLDTCVKGGVKNEWMSYCEWDIKYPTTETNKEIEVLTVAHHKKILDFINHNITLRNNLFSFAE